MEVQDETHELTDQTTGRHADVRAVTSNNLST